MSKKRIEELVAEIQRLKEQKAEIDAAINAAELARYEIERETKRNQKPTPAMRVLLKKLNEGAVIRENRFYPNYYYLAHNGDSDKLRGSLFYGLRDREAIEGDREHGYTITEHGRSFL